MDAKKLHDLAARIQDEMSVQGLDPVEAFRVLIGLLASNIEDIATRVDRPREEVLVWIINEIGRAVMPEDES